jgi:glycerol-3-phosphate dehydrogenase (NAD(P)+)
MRISVLGGGSWGTTLAALATAGGETSLWAYEDAVVRAIHEQHENRIFLPGFALPSTIHATTDLRAALGGADVVVVAVPAQHLRTVIAAAREVIPRSALVVSVAKGLEVGTSKRMSEVLREVLAAHPADSIGVLTGPNLAREVMAGQPSAACVAFPQEQAAEAIQRLFMGDAFRVYTSLDVVGCEIGGAVKNVIAIAAGVADGLGYGLNTKAALITRGLAEMTRLGVALGGRPLTFLGLAGNGDLIATCSSGDSRNHRVGIELAAGRPIQSILSRMQTVAEGVETAPAVIELARRADVEMPIAETVVALLENRLAPDVVVPHLMRREPKAELDGLRDRRASIE